MSSSSKLPPTLSVQDFYNWKKSERESFIKKMLNFINKTSKSVLYLSFSTSMTSQRAFILGTTKSYFPSSEVSKKGFELVPNWTNFSIMRLIFLYFQVRQQSSNLLSAFLLNMLDESSSIEMTTYIIKQLTS